MSATTSIEWCDKTWGPVRGCALVSPGCQNCYAMKFAHRFSNKVNGKVGPYAGLTVLSKNHGPRWNGRARFVPEMLAEPLKWRKPQRVFVNSMSDLFHEDITNEQIAAVFGVMAACPQHTFQILTKRPERMLEWFSWVNHQQGSEGTFSPRISCYLSACRPGHVSGTALPAPGWPNPGPWPLPNVWIGVSAEDQQRADERIPMLLKCPAAVRFVSAEPLLGPIDFTHMDVERPGLDGMYQINALTGRNSDMGRPCADVAKLDWIIAGGESGPGARALDVAWVRSIVEQCRAAGTVVFVKQLGAMWTENRGRREERVGGPDRPFVGGARITGDGTVERTIKPTNRKGGDMAEWPEDLRIRLMPGDKRPTAEAAQ